MNNEQESIFFRTMMTGLFIGIIDTLICLSYNIGYRNMTGYIPSEMINVSSLIFAVNIILLLIGITYYCFVRFFGNKDIVFIAIFLLLTVYLIWKVQTGHRFTDTKVNDGFRGLLTGILVILGLSASVMLPVLYRSKSFAEHVL
jgi:hypothetical protein